jgi:hypothetical protein
VVQPNQAVVKFIRARLEKSLCFAINWSTEAITGAICLDGPTSMADAALRMKRPRGINRGLTGRDMRSDEFIDAAAIIGQLLSINLLAKLIDKGLLNIGDAESAVDEALLMMEEAQGGLPDHRPGFEKARKTMGEFVEVFRKKPAQPPARRGPRGLRDRKP